MLDERLPAQDVRRLPEHDREEERVEGRGVGHDRKHRAPPSAAAQLVQPHLVLADELPHLGYGEGLHARVAGDEDRLEGLARRVLEHLVVEEGEVGVHGDGLGHAHAAVPGFGLERLPPRGVERGVGGAVRPGVPHARLHLLEQQVEGAPVVLVGLLRLGERQQRDHAGERSVLGRAAVHQVADEGDVEKSLGVLPEGIARVVAVAGRVGDEAGDELQDVGLVAHVGDWVVVERLREVDRVERGDLVPGGLEHVPDAGQRLALGVGDEVVRVHLHDVRLEEPAGLARPAAAGDYHVAAALVAPVVVGPAHRHAEALGEDDVLVGVAEVHEAPSLARGAPSGAPVLLSLPLRAPVGERPRPRAPDAAGGHEPRRERGSLEREGAVA